MTFCHLGFFAVDDKLGKAHFRKPENGKCEKPTSAQQADESIKEIRQPAG